MRFSRDCPAAYPELQSLAEYLKKNMITIAIKHKYVINKRAGIRIATFHRIGLERANP
jgi:hypothetical protein